jgi:hypothetical protein
MFYLNGQQIEIHIISFTPVTIELYSIFIISWNQLQKLVLLIDGSLSRFYSLFSLRSNRFHLCVRVVDPQIINRTFVKKMYQYISRRQGTKNLQRIIISQINRVTNVVTSVVQYKCSLGEDCSLLFTMTMANIIATDAAPPVKSTTDVPLNWRSHQYNTIRTHNTTVQDLQLQASAPVLREEVHFLKGFPTKQDAFIYVLGKWRADVAAGIQIIYAWQQRRLTRFSRKM